MELVQKKHNKLCQKNKTGFQELIGTYQKDISTSLKVYFLHLQDLERGTNGSHILLI